MDGFEGKKVCGEWTWKTLPNHTSPVEIGDLWSPSDSEIGDTYKRSDLGPQRA